MHSPCLGLIRHTLIAKRIFLRYCFHFFHSLVPAFPASISYFIKSKIPPSSYRNPSSAPLNLLPLHNNTPVGPLLCNPVHLCYIDQTQCSFCCPVTDLDRTLCMYGKQCWRESVYCGMNCCEQLGPNTKPASVANKSPRKAAPCTGSEFQKSTWTGGGVERLMENANPVLSFHRNKPAWAPFWDFGKTPEISEVDETSKEVSVLVGWVQF